MTRRILFLFFILFGSVAFVSLPVGAQAGSVSQKIINGKSFVMEDGTIVRLACLQAPNIQEQDGKMRPGEPMGEQAKATLTKLVKGQPLRLLPEPPLLDRHGRRVAFVKLANGVSVQEAMLKAGMALVYPFADQREKLSSLQKAERQARDTKRGIWAHPYWRPIEANRVTVENERYRLVQGRVKQVAQAGGNWYLNFGEDYKTDFTAFIPAKDYKRYFAKQDLKPLQGKSVLLRGWVYARDGVMMDVTLPEQIEVISLQNQFDTN